MHCTSCKNHFCWLCLEVINNRSHFEGSQRCDLWEVEDSSPFTRRCTPLEQPENTCMRCQSQQAFQLNCGHFFCDRCWQHEQSHLPEDSRHQASSNYCMQCLNQGQTLLKQVLPKGNTTSVSTKNCQQCRQNLPVITKEWPCGHSFCYSCVIQMHKDNRDSVCAICRHITTSDSTKKKDIGAEAIAPYRQGKQCIFCGNYFSTDLDVCYSCLPILFIE
ncbi:hypothetical protein CI610_03417 [invertebrate metagenome]|uniref:RING-type domain-containing protein n=1 Tax=invertebrate metagenome TaxID=1711999 RepID=A0A2H9T352_9ZZZZ